MRVQHCCEACGQSIEPGERAIYEVMDFGGFITRYTHQVCFEIWMTSLDGEELGDYFETLFYWIKNQLTAEDAYQCVYPDCN